VDPDVFGRASQANARRAPGVLSSHYSGPLREKKKNPPEEEKSRGSAARTRASGSGRASRRTDVCFDQLDALCNTRSAGSTPRDRNSAVGRDHQPARRDVLHFAFRMSRGHVITFRVRPLRLARPCALRQRVPGPTEDRPSACVKHCQTRSSRPPEHVARLIRKAAGVHPAGAAGDTTTADSVARG